MKKLLTLFFIFCSIAVFGQYPAQQTIGSDSTIVKSKGGLQGRIINWRYNDTAQANLERIHAYPGAQIIAGNRLYIRDSTATKWLLTGSGSGIDSVYFSSSTNSDTVFTIKNGIKTFVGIIDYPSGLISGGDISFVSGVTYHVNSAVYRKTAKRYTSPATNVNISPISVGTYRIDMVVGDTLENVSVITGTASTNPTLPAFDNLSQEVFGYIYVGFGASGAQPTTPVMSIFRSQDSVYYVNKYGKHFAFIDSTGSTGGGTVDLSGIYTKTQIDSIIASLNFNADSIYTDNPLHVRDSSWVVGADTLHKQTLFLRTDSMPLMRIIGDTTGMPGNGVPTLDMVEARMGGGGISVVKQTYTGSSTVTVADSTTWLIINPASLVAALTITLPASPTDGQYVIVSFGGTITSGGVVSALTISPTPIDGSSPDYIMAGEHFGYRYNSDNSKWYRIN